MSTEPGETPSSSPLVEKFFDESNPWAKSFGEFQNQEDSRMTEGNDKERYYSFERTPNNSVDYDRSTLDVQFLDEKMWQQFREREFRDGELKTVRFGFNGEIYLFCQYNPSLDHVQMTLGTPLHSQSPTTGVLADLNYKQGNLDRIDLQLGSEGSRKKSGAFVQRVGDGFSTRFNIKEGKINLEEPLYGPDRLLSVDTEGSIMDGYTEPYKISASRDENNSDLIILKAEDTSDNSEMSISFSMRLDQDIQGKLSDDGKEWLTLARDLNMGRSRTVPIKES